MFTGRRTTALTDTRLMRIRVIALSFTGDADKKFATNDSGNRDSEQPRRHEHRHKNKRKNKDRKRFYTTTASFSVYFVICRVNMILKHAKNQLQLEIVPCSMKSWSLTRNGIRKGFPVVETSGSE